MPDQDIAKLQAPHFASFTNPADCEELLKQKKKRLVFLISVGQGYHEYASLDAFIDIFRTLISGCAKVVEAERSSATPQSAASVAGETQAAAGNPAYQYASGAWEIVVAVADTLQAYNCPDLDLTDDDDFRSHQEYWRENGDKYISNFGNKIKQLREAGNINGEPLVHVNVNIYQWREILEASKVFGYETKVDDLRNYYHRYPDSDVHYGIDKQADSFFGRKKRIDTPENREKAFTYITEELAVLQGCIAEGLFHFPANFGKESKDIDSLPVHIVYPGKEIASFSTARQFYREDNTHHPFHVRWLSIEVRTTASSKRMVGFSHRDEVVTEKQINIREIVRRMLFDWPQTIEREQFDYEQFCRGKQVTFDLPSRGEGHHSVERDALLKQLEVSFGGGGSASGFAKTSEATSAAGIKPQANDNNVTVICHGMGGVGKTHLAYEYCLRSAGKYHLELWLDGTSKNKIDSTYKRLGLNLRIIRENTPTAEIRKTVVEWFEEHSGWLIVLDDLAGSLEDFKDYLPHRNGHLLVTSRKADLKNQRAISTAVNCMTEKESIAMLSSGQPQPVAHEYHELARLLEGLPIALEIAVAYMRMHRASPADCVRLYRENSHEMLDAKAGSEISMSKKKVAVVWDASIYAIENPKNRGKASQDPKGLIVAQHARELLAICAYVMQNNIPKEFLVRWFSRKCPEQADVDANVDAILQKLAEYSLIKYHDDFVDIHPVVQEVLRNSFERRAETNFTDYFRNIAETIVEPINDTPEKNWYNLARMMVVPNEVLESVCALLAAFVTKFRKMQQPFVGKDDLRLNLSYAQAALSSSLSKPHIDRHYLYNIEDLVGVVKTASSLNSKGAAAYRSGDYVKALRKFKGACAAAIDEGLTDKDVLPIYKNIAATHNRLSQFEYAANYYSIALKLCEAIHSKDSNHYRDISAKFRSANQMSLVALEHGINPARVDVPVEAFQQKRKAKITAAYTLRRIQAILHPICDMLFQPYASRRFTIAPHGCQQTGMTQSHGIQGEVVCGRLLVPTRDELGRDFVPLFVKDDLLKCWQSAAEHHVPYSLHVERKFRAVEKKGPNSRTEYVWTIQTVAHRKPNPQQADSYVKNGILAVENEGLCSTTALEVTLQLVRHSNAKLSELSRQIYFALHQLQSIALKFPEINICESPSQLSHMIPHAQYLFDKNVSGHLPESQHHNIPFGRVFVNSEGDAANPQVDLLFQKNSISLNKTYKCAGEKLGELLIQEEEAIFLYYLISKHLNDLGFTNFVLAHSFQLLPTIRVRFEGEVLTLAQLHQLEEKVVSLLDIAGLADEYSIRHIWYCNQPIPVEIQEQLPEHPLGTSEAAPADAKPFRIIGGGTVVSIAAAQTRNYSHPLPGVQLFQGGANATRDSTNLFASGATATNFFR
jgi:NB-ARC domain